MPIVPPSSRPLGLDAVWDYGMRGTHPGMFGATRCPFPRRAYRGNTPFRTSNEGPHMHRPISLCVLLSAAALLAAGAGRPVAAQELRLIQFQSSGAVMAGVTSTAI